MPPSPSDCARKAVALKTQPLVRKVIAERPARERPNPARTPGRHSHVVRDHRTRRQLRCVGRTLALWRKAAFPSAGRSRRKASRGRPHSSNRIWPGLKHAARCPPGARGPVQAGPGLPLWRPLSDAIALQEANLQESLRVLGPDHSDTLVARAALAITLLAAGHLTDGLAALESSSADFDRVAAPVTPMPSAPASPSAWRSCRLATSPGPSCSCSRRYPAAGTCWDLIIRIRWRAATRRSWNAWRRARPASRSSWPSGTWPHTSGRSARSPRGDRLPVQPGHGLPRHRADGGRHHRAQADIRGL